jgi:hypothetical protein
MGLSCSVARWLVERYGNRGAGPSRPRKQGSAPPITSHVSLNSIAPVNHQVFAVDHGCSVAGQK